MWLRHASGLPRLLLPSTKALRVLFQSNLESTRLYQLPQERFADVNTPQCYEELGYRVPFSVYDISKFEGLAQLLSISSKLMPAVHLRGGSKVHPSMALKPHTRPICSWYANHRISDSQTHSPLRVPWDSRELCGEILAH